jgi:hypothetical protein
MNSSPIKTIIHITYLQWCVGLWDRSFMGRIQLREAHNSFIAELESHDLLILTTIPKRQRYLAVNL